MRRLTLALALGCGARVAAGQLPVAPLTLVVGTGVDTAAHPQHDVFVLWRDYLRDRPDSARASSYWSRDEQARWPTADLTSTWVYTGPTWQRGLSATVVDLGPDVPGDTSLFVVRTLFARADSATGAPRPVALVRAYAVREGGRWALANALPRLTRDWTRMVIGHVHFVYAPERRPDSALAVRAARFVDSATAILGLPPVTLEYYLTGSPREMMRVLGLDVAVSPNSGRVYAEDRLVVTGSPTTTEWNTHDLAHLVVAPIAGGTRAPRWWNEGVATWVGGRGGRDFATLVRQLEADLARNSGRTLDSVLAPHAWRDSISTTAAAVLVRMAFERGGRAAVQRMVTGPDESPDGVRQAAAMTLGVRPEEVGLAWRRQVAAWARSR